MGLRDTYDAIQTAKGKFQGNAEERDGKLYFKEASPRTLKRTSCGTRSKRSDRQKDVVADIQ
jgi:hypothetical protein